LRQVHYLWQKIRFYPLSWEASGIRSILDAALIRAANCKLAINRVQNLMRSKARRMKVSHPKGSFMLKLARLQLGSLVLLVLASCATHPDYATQFRFPIEWGSITAGQATFVDLDCHQCHTVSGVELVPYAGESPVMLELGGSIAYAKTYADLVTSIINPNHVVSEENLSKLPRDALPGTTTIMPFKDQMTVTQLIDLVKFLNSRYVLMEEYREVYYQ